MISAVPCQSCYGHQKLFTSSIEGTKGTCSLFHRRHGTNAENANADNANADNANADHAAAANANANNASSN